MSETRIVDSQANSWAKEVTLDKLYREARDQTALLEKISGTRAADLRSARRTAENIEDLGDRASTTADALDDAANAAERARKAEEARAQRALDRSREDDRKRREEQYERERREYQYRQSLNDLRSNLNAVSTATPASLWNNLGDRLAVMGGNMSSAGGASRILGASLTGLSRVVAVASLGFSYYKDGFQTLTSMTEAGVLFNGSVEQMRQSIGRTGLSLQDFSRVVGQYSQVIGGVGEQSYARNLRQVQDLTRGFGRYGQTLEQQAESVTAFFDMMRSGGQIFMMTEQQRSRAAADYIAQTTALTRLTGRQRRQIEQEQQQVMMQAEVDLAIREMRARGDTQEANRMEEMVRIFTANLGPEIGLGVAAMQMGITPRNQDVRRLIYTTGIAEEIQRLMASAASPEQITQAVQSTYRRLGESPEILGMMRVGVTAGGSMEGAGRLLVRMFQERGDRLVQAGRTGEMENMLEVMAGRRGILDQAATGFAQVTGDVQRAMGDLRATIAGLTEQFRIFSLAFPALAGATGAGTGLTNLLFGMTQSLPGAALLAGGAYAGYRGLSALSRGTAGMFSRGPMAPGVFPTPPGALPLPGGAGVSRTGLLRGGVYGAAGMGAGYLASSLGAPTWASGALSGAGTGAAIGAMFGPAAPLATLAGAAIGGIIGGVSSYFGGGEAAPAPAGAAPDLGNNMARLNAVMTDGLGPGGAIATRIDLLIAAVNNSSAAIVRAVREQ